jgi:hypothetical protein
VGKPLAVSYRHLAGGKKKQIDIQTVVFIRTRDEFACPITSHGRFQPFNKSLSSLSDQHHLLGNSKPCLHYQYRLSSLNNRHFLYDAAIFTNRFRVSLPS